MSLTHTTSTNLTEPESVPSSDAPSTEGASSRDTTPSRRRSRRQPVRGICTMRPDCGPSQVFGGLVDVSSDGVLVKTEATLEVGTRVDLQIDFVGSKNPGTDEEDSERDSIEAAGIVRRRTDTEGRTAYGIEFVQDDTHRDTLLEEYEHSFQ